MGDSSWGSFGTNVNTSSHEPEKTEDVRERETKKERPGRDKDRDPRERAPKKRARRDRGTSVGDFLGSISPENWVDIVCCTLIAVFLIVVACNWAEFSRWLFESVLFPIISIGAKIVSFVAGVGVVIGAIVLWIRSRTRRRWF